MQIFQVFILALILPLAVAKQAGLRQMDDVRAKAMANKLMNAFAANNPSIKGKNWEIKGVSQKELQETAGGPAASFLTIANCDAASLAAIAAEGATSMTQAFLADTCLDVRDTDNNVDVGVKITSTAATATLSMYAATDCSGSAADSMSMTLNECTADEGGDASSIATYMASSTAYTTMGGLTTAYIQTACADAPVTWTHLGLANGACFKTDDAASMKLTYTATGCTMENFNALECPSANSQGELEIVTGVCADESQTIDYITGQITCAKQAIFCTAPAEDADDDAICFGGSETLLLESGASVSMENVRVGDRVQIATFDGALEFADVVFIPHEKNSRRAAFVEIETAHGSLKVTPTHLVMAGKCGGNMALTRAEDIAVGSCMDGVSGQEAVTASTKTISDGVYSIITAHPDGIIVVNGFKASSFALNHAVGNAYYQIHRALYTVAPGMLSTLAGVGNLIGSFVFYIASA